MILGLFGQLLGAGGIQRIGRHSVACLAAYAQEQGEEFRCLSLSDPLGSHEFSIEGITYTFEGFARNKLAYALARKNDAVVLFSPGCASFDMFRDYEDRGDQFRALVQSGEAIQ